MFIITYLFDKLGYMPKISIDTSWPFPVVEKPYTPHEFEVKPKKAVKKAVKIPKATTRKPKTK